MRGFDPMAWVAYCARQPNGPGDVMAVQVMEAGARIAFDDPERFDSCAKLWDEAFEKVRTPCPNP